MNIIDSYQDVQKYQQFSQLLDATARPSPREWAAGIEALIAAEQASRKLEEADHWTARIRQEMAADEEDELWAAFLARC